MKLPLGVEHFSALTRLGLDIVSLALPPQESAAASEFFLQQGLPVLSEKPLADTSMGAERIAKKSAGIPTAIDFQFPELRAFREARYAIHSGEIGAIRHAQVTWMVESYALRHGLSGWKTESSRYGGVLSALLPHVLHLVDWLLSCPERVSAYLLSRGVRWTSTSVAAVDTVDFACQLEGGAHFSAFVSNASPGSHLHAWHIVGERGSVIVENRALDYMAGFSACISRSDGALERLAPVEGSPLEDGRIAPFASLAARFADCIRTNRPMRPDFLDGWRTQALADSILDAASKHAEIQFERGAFLR